MIVKAKFQVVLPPREQKLLEEAVQTQGAREIVKAFSGINGEKAEAFKQTDREMIHAAVKSLPGGFAELNTAVTSALRSWLEASLTEALQRLEQEDGATLSERTVIFIEHFAWVLEQHGRLDTAEQYYKRAMERNDQTPGVSLIRRLRTKINLSNVYSARGHLQQMLDLLEPEIVNLDALNSPQDAVALLLNVASCYGRLQTQTAKALELYRRAKDIHESQADQDDAMKALGLALDSNIATSIVELGDWEKGLALMRDVHKRRAEFLGAEHSDTLRTGVVLATKLMEKPNLTNAEFQEAMGLLETGYHGYSKVFGPHAQMTLITLKQRAICLARAGLSDRSMEDFITVCVGFQKGMKLSTKELLPDIETGATRIGPKGREFLTQIRTQLSGMDDPEVAGVLEFVEARCLFIINDAQAAKPLLNSALDKLKNNGEYRQRILLIRFMNESEKSAAEADFLELIRMPSLSIQTKIQCKSHMAIVLLGDSNPEACVKFVSSFLAEDKKNLSNRDRLEAERIRGVAYFKLNDWENAKQSLQLFCDAPKEEATQDVDVLVETLLQLAEVENALNHQESCRDRFFQAFQAQWKSDLDAMDVLRRYITFQQSKSSSSAANNKEKEIITQLIVDWLEGTKDKKQSDDSSLNLNLQMDLGVILKQQQPQMDTKEILGILFPSQSSSNQYSIEQFPEQVYNRAMDVLNGNNAFVEFALDLWTLFPPKSGDGVYKRASALWKLQKYDVAGEMLVENIELLTKDDSLHVPAVTMATQANFALKQYEKVIRIVTLAQHNKSYNEQLNREAKFDLEFLRAKAALLLGQFEQALKWIKVCSELAPNPTQKLKVAEAEELARGALTEQQQQQPVQASAPTVKEGSVGSPETTSTENKKMDDKGPNGQGEEEQEQNKSVQEEQQENNKDEVGNVSSISQPIVKKKSTKKTGKKSHHPHRGQQKKNCVIM